MGDVRQCWCVDLRSPELRLTRLKYTMVFCWQNGSWRPLWMDKVRAERSISHMKLTTLAKLWTHTPDNIRYRVLITYQQVAARNCGLLLAMTIVTVIVVLAEICPANSQLLPLPRGKYLSRSRPAHLHVRTERGRFSWIYFVTINIVTHT